VIENKISGTDTGTLTTLTHQTLLNHLNKMGKQTQNAAAAWGQTGGKLAGTEAKVTNHKPQRSHNAI